MINISRPIDVFSFTLLTDFIYQNKTIKAGQVQLKRGERLANGAVNPNIYVYSSEDLYNKPYAIINDKFVKELISFIKYRQLEEGDYGDFGNEDMKENNSNN